MKKLPYFPQRNLVATKLLSGKLTFLRGVYKNNRLVSAQMFEQNLALAPDEKDGEPKFVADLDLNQTPFLFSVSGGERWQYQKDESYEGLMLVCEFGNRGRLKEVKQVCFDVVHSYSYGTSAYQNLGQNGKTFGFRPCRGLALDRFVNQKEISYCPVYMLPENENGFDHFEGLYPRSSAGEKLRFLGCNTFEKGRYCNFIIAESLPDDLVKYFSR